jgi:hypothetical protein
MPRRKHHRRREDEVIDLRDRLSPYEGSALRPMEREARDASEEVEPPVWTPLDLGSLFQTTDRRKD